MSGQLMAPTRRIRLFALIPSLIALAPLAGQEFEFGISAPEAIHMNSAFEVTFTITSRGIPPLQAGVNAWTLAVSHEGLELLSATTEGTVVDELFDEGFKDLQITVSDSVHPDNDGFISAVLLSIENPDSRLPPAGTVTVAGATYRAGAIACSSGARLAITDGLEGKCQPAINSVTWNSSTYFPAKMDTSYSFCEANDYRLHLSGPESPFQVRLGE